MLLLYMIQIYLNSSIIDRGSNIKTSLLDRIKGKVKNEKDLKKQVSYRSVIGGDPYVNIDEIGTIRIAKNLTI